MAKENEFVRKAPKKTDNGDALYGFAHKLLPILLIVMSFSLAGTYFARQYPEFVQNDRPMFYWGTAPVYTPWQYLVWYAREYSFSAVKDDAYAMFEPSSLVIAVGTGIALVLYFVLSYLRGIRHKFDNIYGTARWAKIKDLIRNGLDADTGIVLGQRASARIAISIKNGEIAYKLKQTAPIIAHYGTVHSIAIAPSRSGKGLSIVIPTLISWRGSVIVFDPKGENYNKTAGFRSRFSHVLRYSPTDPQNSIHINPLQEIRAGEFAFRDASNIAEILVSPSGGEGAQEGSAESHFIERAKSLLTGLILHVLTSPYHKDKSLAGVLDFVSSIPVNSEDGDSDNGAGLLHEMLETDHSDPVIHTHVKHIAVENLQTPDRERGSIFSTVTKALWLFEDPLIRASTSDHELSIDDFYTAKNPISLYLTVPYSDLDRLAPIIRLIVSFYVRRFSEGETAFGKQKLAFRTLFLLDEFPVLGRFSFLEKAMGILAGYGVTFLVIVQSLTQIQKIYGDKNPFMEHCKIWVTFAPGDFNSAKLFSDVVGKETVWKDSVSTSGSKFEIGMKNMNLSGSEIERNLINPDEIMKLPPDSMLIFCHGMPPYLGKKVIYYADSRFNTIVDLPVPKGRAQIVSELPRKGNLSETWKAPEGEVIHPALLKKVADGLPDAGFAREADSLPAEILYAASMQEEEDKGEIVPSSSIPDYDDEKRIVLHRAAAMFPGDSSVPFESPVESNADSQTPEEDENAKYLS